MAFVNRLIGNFYEMSSDHQYGLHTYRRSGSEHYFPWVKCDCCLSLDNYMACDGYNVDILPTIFSVEVHCFTVRKVSCQSYQVDLYGCRSSTIINKNITYKLWSEAGKICNCTGKI